MNQIGENILRIRERIEAAARNAGRNPEEVRLMAVSKTRSREEILEAYRQGMRLFGENRVQEMKEKFTDMPEDLELHLIGHLQRNKAAAAAGMAVCIHSLDKWETLTALDKACRALGKKMDVLLEINTSGEESKNGFTDNVCFFETVEKSLELEMITVTGLMTMAPFTDDRNAVRRSFRALRELRDRTLVRFPEMNLPVLSMGMSGDFETAVEEGSTLVRVGTMLFGERRA